MRGRINQLETELANVNLKLLMTQELPDSNLGIYEDFKTVDQVDDFKVRVTVFASGEIRQIASVEKRQFGSAEIRQFESIEKSQS